MSTSGRRRARPSYGTSVPADTVTTIYGPEGVGQVYSLTFHEGDLWISDQVGGLQVLSPTDATIYGVSVTADMGTTIVGPSSNIAKEQVAFDADENLYFGDSADTAGQGSVDVLAAASGTLFGQSVTANDVTALVTGLNQPDGVAVDPSGNLYYGDDSEDNVSVLPVATGSIFGEPETADTPGELFAGF